MNEFAAAYFLVLLVLFIRHTVKSTLDEVIK